MCSRWRELHDEDLRTLRLRGEFVDMLPALVARFPTVRAASLTRLASARCGDEGLCLCQRCDLP